ncbi:MarR family winged helix-turn-helix transcriptional regulator [Streptomyces sp. NBC_00258]|uniref:MarR family winged helix-turn-helix transcriptional regulator n=1 Tax=Streptomyces sp. NBC_00258 TaxID=2903642 RepID=UPI002E2D61DD|nr:MarR family transcriptional regulator [Streptomyces sp. NBC_00258]
MTDAQSGEPRPEPDWLTDNELAAWEPLAAMLVKLPPALDAQVQRDIGVNHFEYGVLANLAKASDRRLRLRELAARASGSLSRVSHAVKRLEQRGWVVREPTPDDSRYADVVLTDAGWAAGAAAAPGHVATVRRLVIDHLSATQLRYVRSICTRVVKQLDIDEVEQRRR